MSDSRRLRSVFDLPTQQRRLRHLKSLAMRNLICKGYMGKDVIKLQTYFTLHRDVQSKAFYASEKITGSLNPTWQSFDLSRLQEEVNMMAKFVVVRVWGGHDKKFKLLLEWQVNFSGLAFLADKLQRDGMKFAANSLVFGLFEKYFSIDETTDNTSQQAAAEEDSSIPTRQAVVRVDQIAIRNSYGVSSLSRIHTILRAIKQTQAMVKRVHHSIEDKLLASQQTSTKLSDREELLLRVHQLRGELQWQTSQLQTDKDKHDKLKYRIKLQGTTLKENFSTSAKSRIELHERKQQYISTRETLVKTNAQLNMRRKQLIEETSAYIYPITEVPNNKGYLINSILLPNAEEFQGHDDVRISVALGYTCHMVVMMSQYLDIPLWYPMQHRGSKSVVRDHIISKLADKDREFLLYGKSKDKIQFHYGVYLLNKNISQLRYHFGLGTQDLRMTLHNLKSLLELRLGVKFDQHIPLPNITAGRHDVINSTMSSVKPTSIKPDEREEITAEANDDQMIEQLMNESRAMTGDPNQSWVENLNSKSTWSPSMCKKVLVAEQKNHLSEITVADIHDSREDLFRRSHDQFFQGKTLEKLKLREDGSGKNVQYLQRTEIISDKIVDQIRSDSVVLPSTVISEGQVSSASDTSKSMAVRSEQTTFNLKDISVDTSASTSENGKKYFTEDFLESDDDDSQDISFHKNSVNPKLEFDHTSTAKDLPFGATDSPESSPPHAHFCSPEEITRRTETLCQQSAFRPIVDSKKKDLVE